MAVVMESGGDGGMAAYFFRLTPSVLYAYFCDDVTNLYRSLGSV